MLQFLESTADATGGGMYTIVMLAIMVGIMYFLMIRPESKRKKKDEEMRSSIRNGDEIITIGGICGTVVDVKEDRIVIETSKDQVRMELAKWSVSSNETQAAAQKEKAKKEQEAKAKAKAAKKVSKDN